MDYYIDTLITVVAMIALPCGIFNFVVWCARYIIATVFGGNPEDVL